MICGLCTIALSAELDPVNKFWSFTLNAGGASVFGTSVAILATSFSETGLGSLIAKNLQSRLTSAEEEVDKYRHKWHHYYLTRRDGNAVWNYLIYDFTQSRAPGVLKAVVTTKGSQGQSHTYAVQGFARKERTIFLEEGENSDEPPVVHVVPFMGVRAFEPHCGISFLSTWDGGNIVGPCIFSSSPLVPQKEGGLSPENAAYLTTLWKKNFGRLSQVELF
jgi:hypothetical protein